MYLLEADELVLGDVPGVVASTEGIDCSVRYKAFKHETWECFTYAQAYSHRKQ